MKIGRNDPCPCGSGRKYKQCCLQGQATTEADDDLVWRRVNRVARDYAPAMMRFVKGRYGVEAVDEAWDEFMLWDDDVPVLDQNTPHMQVFTPWFFHSWAPDPFGTRIADAGLHDRTPTSVYVEQRGRQLDPVLRRYLEACVHAPLSFFEIRQIDPGRGFDATDIFTGEEWRVLERSASQTLRPGEILFAQFVPIDGIAIMEACSPFGFQPIHKLELLELRKRMQKPPGKLVREDLAQWDTELRDLYLMLFDATVNPPMPALHNTDGDELLMHELTYEVPSAQDAFDALKHLAAGHSEEELQASAQRDAQGRVSSVNFGWTRRVPSRKKSLLQNPVLGFIEIEGGRLTAQLNSAKRAAAFRKAMEEALGDRARLVSTEVHDVQAALKGSRAAGAGGRMRDELPGASATDTEAAAHEKLMESPEVRDKIREIMTKHYERWLHDKIPALGNRTPLEAARSKEGREKVEALVAQIEHDGSTMNPPLDPGITAMLRKRLKLQRAGT